MIKTKSVIEVQHFSEKKKGLDQSKNRSVLYMVLMVCENSGNIIFLGKMYHFMTTAIDQRGKKLEVVLSLK